MWVSSDPHHTALKCDVDLSSFRVVIGYYGNLGSCNSAEALLPGAKQTSDGLEGLGHAISAALCGKSHEIS